MKLKDFKLQFNVIAGGRVNGEESYARDQRFKKPPAS